MFQNQLAMSFNCVQGTPRERRETNTSYSVVLTWQSITSLNEMRFPGNTSIAMAEEKGGLDTDWTELQGLTCPWEQSSAHWADGVSPCHSQAMPSRRDAACISSLTKAKRFLRSQWPLAKLLEFCSQIFFFALSNDILWSFGLISWDKNGWVCKLTSRSETNSPSIFL